MRSEGRVVPGPTQSLREMYEDLGGREGVAPGRAESQLRLLREVRRPSGRPMEILDVGSGDGWLATLAEKAVTPARVVAVEWADSASLGARGRGLDVVRADIDSHDLPFPDDTFDVVMMSEVIEHLFDPDHATAECRRVLVTGGTLLVSTPNLAAWFNRALLLVGVQPVFSEVSRLGVFGRPGTDIVGHLRLFTRRALSEFLHAHGFEDIRVKGTTFHGVPGPLKPFDRALSRWPGVAAGLVAAATKPVAGI